MLPKTHILIGAIFTFIIFFIYPQINLINLIIIFLSTFLIDIDHYLYYVHRKKDLSLKNAYNWFIEREKKWRKLSFNEKKKYKIDLMIFHGIEFLFIIFLLSFINKIFFYILIGISLHMLLDHISLISFNIPLYVKVSQIYLYITNKNKKELK